MKCPACQGSLSERSVADVKLDVCAEGCGGIWFDRHEFKKFDEPFEPNPEDILKVNIQKPNPSVSSDPRKCPRCSDRIMMRHFASIKMKVAVDECPECAGFWLDSGELLEIRNEFGNEEQRKAAAEQFFDENFRKPSAADYKKYQRLGNAFRFLAPSYYLGKK